MHSTHHKDYKQRVREYVAWRRDMRSGRTFTSAAKVETRRERGRALLDRQAAREKSGFYEETMALANILGQRMGRLYRRHRGENGWVRLA